MIGQWIDCGPDEEHFLRRLGGALIVHWDELRSDLQDEILRQAANMADRQPVSGAETAIRAFIEAHKGGDL